MKERPRKAGAKGSRDLATRAYAAALCGMAARSWRQPFNRRDMHYPGDRALRREGSSKCHAGYWGCARSGASA